MTRKDFQLIANVVKTIDDKKTRDAVAVTFAQKLNTINPRFDMTRFCLACKPTEI
jgi:hypothetical protein|tara:strand:+ start:171 stop:335 length:165 start_codon:yes stop_codon:yes gene_type:complete